MASSQELKQMADKLRIHSIRMTTAAKSGHPTTCLSCAEIMSVSFFSELDKEDEFVLSKGHAAPILWASYAEAGLIDKKELLNLRKIDSMLEGHPTANMPLIRVATGSLGQGLSAGVGMALGKRIEKSDGRVYVLMGDGEVAEGSVWEAANTASYYKLNNLVAIIDVNRLGQSAVTMHGHDVDAYIRKFEAFGWDSAAVDGHDVDALLNILEEAKSGKKPFAIIAKTFKGKGVSFAEDKEGWHGKPFNEEQAEEATAEIGEQDIKLKSRFGHKTKDFKFSNFDINKYEMTEKVATRVAAGKALLNLGKKNHDVVVVDADTKNSTMTEYFFNEFPERSFDAHIAEQNMVGMGIGLASLGYTPFTSTFATFFTRAHDFIRMAQYSDANIKFIGSHAGISIGADGPSQMGLEDIPMFLNMPNSVVLYPSDAVSTENLVKEMAKERGIAYMRTTREKTPILYDNKEEFPIGGLKVLKKTDQDTAMVVTSGLTVHEALKAHDVLKEKGISLRVIDLYSLKPFDARSLADNAKEVGQNVIVVEDHYCGAIGYVVSSVLEKVKHLCVKSLPRSGGPEELLKMFEIDSEAIVKMVMAK